MKLCVPLGPQKSQVPGSSPFWRSSHWQTSLTHFCRYQTISDIYFSYVTLLLRYV